MAITYTPNIGLKLQENKQDYLNWDAIVYNWNKIDEEIGALKGNVITMQMGVPILLTNGTDLFTAGNISSWEEL